MCILSDDHRLCEGHVDHCGCAKPAGCWGENGFHWIVDQRRGTKAFYEECPAYAAARQRARAAQKPAVEKDDIFEY